MSSLTSRHTTAMCISARRKAKNKEDNVKRLHGELINLYKEYASISRKKNNLRKKLVEKEQLVEIYRATKIVACALDGNDSPACDMQTTLWQGYKDEVAEIKDEINKLESLFRIMIRILQKLRRLKRARRIYDKARKDADSICGTISRVWIPPQIIRLPDLPRRRPR